MSAVKPSTEVLGYFHSPLWGDFAGAHFFSANVTKRVQAFSSVMKGWIKFIAVAVLGLAGCASPQTNAPRAEAPHWAFEPIRSPEPPRVQNEAWVQNPIDRFILAKLEAANV
jgi:hypothetical protein